ncbi:acyltransferase family protein [Pseudomonas fluorescens]|uniref:Acyltransferase 3 domain-containing protein n=1 Tax=Pseudomonas fluorescens TaxID=294 RepID=A0A5E7ABP8_PSEFL|nr:acyltransferase [Pseudomonas fluorescens]VVN76742.1 hypothetical protein PS723_00773 [Pseudomonas fluorescens]
MQKEHRFQALDSFRGLCALAVVVYHLRVVGSFTELEFFRNSAALVAFFFVLSGFVLAHAYGSKMTVDIRRFFISRTFRLFPLHLFMLGVFILLEVGRYIAHQKGMEFNNEPFTGKFAPSGIIPNLFLVQSWTSLTNPLSFNYPSWSISIEYYTYMIFAVTLGIALVGRKLLWAAISLLAFVLIYQDNVFFTQESLRGLSCFFAGCLTYVVFIALTKVINPGFWLLTVLEGVSLICAATLMMADIEQKATVVSLMFCLVIVIFAFDGGAFSRLLNVGFFKFLGKLSYSIYLTHAAILFCALSVFMVASKVIGIDFTTNIDGDRYLDIGNVWINNTVAMLIVSSVVVLSMFTYKYIEMKGQAYGRTLINKKPAEAEKVAV